ncbi:MAG: MBL fold metallo-hydrolase [candidate division WOR-3 bacterium]
MREASNIERSAQRVYPIDMGLAKAFLIRGARSVLVDTGDRRGQTRLLQGLERHGVRPSELSLIVITHGHHDHYGNIAELKRLGPAVPVAIQRLDASALSSGVDVPIYLGGPRGLALRLGLPQRRRPRFLGIDADILVDDELDLKPFGVLGRALATPGHTPGSLSVILDSGEAIVGDLVMGSILTATVPVISFWAFDEATSRASIQRVLELRPRTVFASHGGPFDPQRLARKFSRPGRNA